MTTTNWFNTKKGKKKIISYSALKTCWNNRKGPPTPTPPCVFRLPSRQQVHYIKPSLQINIPSYYFGLCLLTIAILAAFYICKMQFTNNEIWGGGEAYFVTLNFAKQRTTSISQKNKSKPFFPGKTSAKSWRGTFYNLEVWKPLQVLILWVFLKLTKKLWKENLVSQPLT